MTTLVSAAIVTARIMAEIAASVGVAWEPSMQAWPLEVADSKRLPEFLDHYDSERREGHRRALAELIAFSLDAAFAMNLPPVELLDRAAEVFREDADLLDYWACWGATSEEGMFSLSAWARLLK